MLTFDLDGGLIAHSADVRGAVRKVAYAAAASDPAPGSALDAALDELARVVHETVRHENPAPANRPADAAQVRRALAAGPSVPVE